MNKKHRWTSPSNIAIVKYWGKLPGQLPMNPSLSFTLSSCHTETEVEWNSLPPSGDKRFVFYFDGSERPDFNPKLEQFFRFLDGEMPWLQDCFPIIRSSNTFPHSSGIASSASAMSALALCLVSMERDLFPERFPEELLFWRRSSEMARIGSGSACRSVFPLASLWGKTPSVPEGDDRYGIPFAHRLHPLFHGLRDYIFVVNASGKAVSSSAGHTLMAKHPYREARIAQAHHNLDALVSCLACGDWNEFSRISEEEALSLHALMMSSQPWYLLLEAESLNLLQAIKSLRESAGLPVCFTIDAGPNIHLLFPESCENEVENWIASEWKDYLLPGKLIRDCIGKGPVERS